MTSRVALHEVDAVEVTIVMDMFVDILMAGQENFRRFPLAYSLVERLESELAQLRSGRPS